MKRWHRLGRVVQYPEVWILTLVALLTRLWNIGWPHSLVFDEVYFREFASNYLSGWYFFDVHPPFVKLLFAGVAVLFQLSPEQAAAGEPGGIILRTLPAIAGAALVPLIYIILRQFRMGRHVATLGASLVLLDNALLVESRFVLMDSLMLLAGFGALSSFLAFRHERGRSRWVWIILTAILLGVVVSTKWSGLAMAGFIFIIWFVDGFRSRRRWTVMLTEFSITIAMVLSIYLGSFALHFALLTHTGEGDAFMSEKFQSTLIDSAYYDPTAHISFGEELVELNEEMYRAQTSLNDTSHPYESKWYEWPIMARSVYYWQGEELPNGIQGHIYLLGNPVVWLLATTGTALTLLLLLIKNKWLGRSRNILACLLVGYALNFIPFAFIDRPMFLYHYLFAFIISVLITSILLGRFFDWQAKEYGKGIYRQTFWLLIAVISLGFLYFLPLSYGWPLDVVELQQRMWMPSWR